MVSINRNTVEYNKYVLVVAAVVVFVTVTVIEISLEHFQAFIGLFKSSSSSSTLCSSIFRTTFNHT